MRRVLATLFILCAVAAPAGLYAQARWVGVGAIGRTAMLMDTASIERDGSIRRVWIESLDPEPTIFVIGHDTTRFDAVIALHVFNCVTSTHTVAAARYYLAGVEVAPPRPADTTPEKLRPGTFMAAVASDLCSDAHTSARSPRLPHN